MKTDLESVGAVIIDAQPASATPLATTHKPRLPASSVLVTASDEVTGLARLIELAIQHGRPVDELTRAFEQVLALRARQQFAQALHAFAGEVTPVPKTKWANMTGRNADQEWGFAFAPLPVIDEHIKPICQKHGLSYAWAQDRPDAQGVFAVWCIVRHSGGHEERTPFYSSIGTNPKLSGPQNTAGGNSFAMRQSLVMAFGLSQTDNFDDEELLAKMHAPPTAKPRSSLQTPQRRQDAPAAPARPQTAPSAAPAAAAPGGRLASDKQCAMIKRRADRAGVGETDLLKRFRLDSLDRIPSDQVDPILEYINRAQPGMGE